MRNSSTVLSWLTILLGGIQFLSAQVTYSDDIAEVIYTKCASCHRTGEIGPMSLSSYEEVSDWAETIKYVTQERIMPPWQADPDYSNFLGENYLSQDQIDMISEWVDAGMPRGQVADEPDFPDFPSGSVLGTPDLVLTMEEAFLHKGDNKDNYRYFVLPSGLLEDKIVKAVEFRPGNTQIVHHALVFEDTTGKAAENDAKTPEYGFEGFGSFNGADQGSILNQKQYPGYVPGQKPILYPDGIGQTLRAGADVVVQVHYAPWPVDQTDLSSINFFFADEDEQIEREVQGHIMVPFQQVIGEQFVIRANQVKEFHGIWNIPKDISFIGLSPHMHLLGKHWEVYLEKANGDIVNMIRINDWDFNWQGSYSFDRFITAEAGSKIHAIASYDNTSENPNNPSNPPRFVTWGEGTEDEMYFLPLNYVDYQEGDEDIRFSETTSTIEIEEGEDFLFPLTPNPVNEFSLISFYLAKSKTLKIEIYDLQGRRIRVLRESEFFNVGKHDISLNTNSLDAGIYFVKLSGYNLELTRKFVKQ